MFLSLSLTRVVTLTNVVVFRAIRTRLCVAAEISIRLSMLLINEFILRISIKYFLKIFVSFRYEFLCMYRKIIVRFKWFIFVVFDIDKNVTQIVNRIKNSSKVSLNLSNCLLIEKLTLKSSRSILLMSFRFDIS